MNKISLHIAFQKLLSLGYVALACLGICFFLLKINNWFSDYYIVFWIFIFGVLCLFMYQIVQIFTKNWAKNILHIQNKNLEYSLDLALKKTKNWLENQQVNQVLTQKVSIDYKAKFPFAIVGLLSFATASFIPQQSEKKEKILIQNAANQKHTVLPKIPFQFGELIIYISPPRYTSVEPKYSKTLDIEAPENSTLRWEIVKNTKETIRFFISTPNGKKQAFSARNHNFVFEDKLISSGLYSIVAYNNVDSLLYQSPFYNLMAVKDNQPKITPNQKDLFTKYAPSVSSNLAISANIKDDYAIQKVQIVATLARGNGENVKFKEKIITLSSETFKEKNLSYILDLKNFNFEPGDELFYYWLAMDNKWPEPNIAKSETFFLKYPNPKEIETEDPGSMAMQTLPEYFRSQRQIIIDTEKLIKKRGKIKKPEFDEESNTIGFDQKSLRIRYGQYLGEEYETNLGHAGEADDPLASFTHDHDGGEHEDSHPAETHPGHATESKSSDQDPLAALMEQYVHSHDDGEMNTFYEQSTQSLLKMALEQMWQSELHLRLYEPEKALPFENKALEYLKEAQQKARNYVKKTGFDPTPIKEKEKRLTGKLEKTNPELRFVRFLAKEEMKSLCSKVLGILEQKDLSRIDKLQVADLIQILPVTSSIKTELKNILNGDTKKEASKNKIKDELLKYLSYLKSNNSLSTNQEINEKLNVEFLKQIAHD